MFILIKEEEEEGKGTESAPVAIYMMLHQSVQFQ